MKASQKWRINQGQRTISPMINRSDLLKAMIISILAAIITVVPYIVAHFHAEPAGIFSGFLINPIDGFSYLAKMRQGYEGNWLFHLPYTVEPGEGALIFVYFLFLGQLTRLFGISPIFLYHMVRFLGSVMMFYTAYLLISRFLTSKRHRWWAFAIILFGGGLGWLLLPFGILASDLLIVESVPFVTAYANAHFPFATTLLLILIILMVSNNISMKRKMVAAFLVSTLLAAIQPFSMIPLFIFLFLWLTLETWIEAKTRGVKKIAVKAEWLVYFSMICGALPWFIYDLWLTLHHPEISAWNAQNITPSPPVIEYIFGFGGVLLIAIYGLLRGQFKNMRIERLLMVWVVTQMILLYAPFGLQRRLSMGLYFPLVIMAVMALEKLIKNDGKLQQALLVLLVLSIPSNLIVIGSGIAGVMKMDPLVVLERDEMEAYQWLSSNADPGQIILAGPTAGNRIPAYANLRVFYGHPFETVNAEEQRVFIEQAYSSDDLEGENYQKLQELGVSYIFYGPEEKEFGKPNWLESCELILHSGEYAVFEIPNQ